MKYLIVKNKSQVLLGPMDWRQRMFQSEINEMFDNGDISTKYSIPPVEPESNYLNVGEGIEIFPIVSSITPNHDTNYQTLAGPYYTYSNNKAYETYNVISIPLENSKSALKSLVTANRYIKEQAGFKLTIQNEEVTIDTARGSRDIFLQTYAMMNDNERINWKFPETWLSITKTELGLIVVSGKAHIQSCFDWELSKHNEIDAATTVEQLKAIVLE